MKRHVLPALAAAFAIALIPASTALAHGGFGGRGFGGRGFRGGGFRGGVIDPWWGWGYPYYGYYGDPYPYYPYYGAATITPSRAPIAGNLVVEVQAGLARAGYYHGAVDGMIGPLTRDAIARYQAAHNLAVTSTINDALLGSLRRG